MLKTGLKYYAERSIGALPQAGEILRTHPDIEWIDDYQAFRRETVPLEKRSVIFARKRGPWLKPFHCYHQNHEYRYFSLDIAEGCLFDCVYCYLQSYLNHQALVLFLDESSLIEEVRAARQSWISTGLLSDSFLAEDGFPLIAELSRHVSPDSILELRSKSAEMKFMANPAIAWERVVLSWSLNPEPIVKRYEFGTASLAQRLKAAQEAVRSGFRVAFHLDPVFYFEGWEEAYQSLFRQIDLVPPAAVAFLSLGLFRYMPDLGAIIRKRFPLHEMMTGEFFPDTDGKYHYFRNIRKKMYTRFADWLKPWQGTVPIFWSMEPDQSLTPKAG